MAGRQGEPIRRGWPSRGLGSGWRGRGPGWGWLVVAGAAIAAAVRAIRGISCGHDFDFHLVSWLEAQRAWHEGVPWPHWTQSPNWGAGEPRFVFYPPLTWMAGALLGTLTSWETAPTLLVFLCFLAMGLATRALALRVMDARRAAVAGMVAPVLPYVLFTAYERSAFGELAAAALVPLVVLLALRESEPEAGFTRRNASFRSQVLGGTVPLSLVVAAAWLTNAPGAVMISYLLALVAVVGAVVRRAWWPLARAAAGVTLGMGLAAVFVVPAAWEQRWIAVKEAIARGSRVEDSWLFARHVGDDMGPHDQVLSYASFLVVLTVAVAVVAALTALWTGRRSGRWRETTGEQRAIWAALAVVVPVLLALQFPASAWVWHLAPKLEFLQFPWRWLMVLGTPAAVFAAAATPMDSGRARLRSLGMWLVVMAMMVGGASLVFFQYCDEEDRSLNQVAVFQAGTGVVGSDEYAPTDAENDLVAAGLPDGCLVEDAQRPLGKADEGGVLEWYAGQGDCAQVVKAALWQNEHKIVRVTAERNGWLVLRLRRYPAWRVTVNGVEQTNLPERADGLMAVPVAAGAETVDVSWRTTEDVWVGRGVSALALVLLAGLVWLGFLEGHGRRRRRGCEHL